jgi:hypothetical protein
MSKDLDRINRTEKSYFRGLIPNRKRMGAIRLMPIS